MLDTRDPLESLVPACQCPRGRHEPKHHGSVSLFPAQNADAQAVLKVARDRLQGKFNFHTMTIQIESYSEDMKNCQECQGPSE